MITRKRNTRDTIVADTTFILATRDTGYRDCAAAIAELIDNSLQAEARHIRVLIRENEAARPHRLIIGVLDDGQGMTAATLRTAVRFGGTERFADRSGLGRFGMGLPNGSVSQTRRFDVFTWQSAGNCLHTYLDIDEIATGEMQCVPPPRRRHLPSWIIPSVSATGTLVVWTRCDRLPLSSATTIARNLCSALGRLYRYPIWGGVHITVNDVPVRAVDPLFIRRACEQNGGAPYGARLKYEFSTVEGKSSTVHVRFSELPIRQWHRFAPEEKRKKGIVGGAGVSIVRAGREIDSGWLLMGAKRRENYDDWWRCEIRFDPELDELFGVSHSKQGISPSAELRSALAPDLERIARKLNARVRAKFERIKEKVPSNAVRKAAARDRFLPRIAAPQQVVRAAGLTYEIRAKPIRTSEFYKAALKRGKLLITLNQEHPFFTRLYQPAKADPTGRELYHVECMLLAAARAELCISRKCEKHCVDRMRRAWADTLATFLDT